MAAQLGYCGLDRQRRPLTGDEIRPCWEAADATGATIPSLPGVGPVWPLDLEDDRTIVRPLQFVEVPSADAPNRGALDTPVDPIVLGAPDAGEPRWSLWGEPEA